MFESEEQNAQRRTAMLGVEMIRRADGGSISKTKPGIPDICGGAVHMAGAATPLQQSE